MTLERLLSAQTEQEFLDLLDIVATELEININESCWKQIVQLMKDSNPLIRNNKDTYHNWIHIVYVTVLAFYISVDKILIFDERRSLFFACLFHDWGHTCGVFNNTINLNIAIGCMTAILTPQVAYSLGIRKFDVKFIKRLILASGDSCGDANIDFMRLTVLEKVIRDADLTMTLSVLSPQFARGLNNELDTEYYNHSNMLKFARSQTVYSGLISHLLQVQT